MKWNPADQIYTVLTRLKSTLSTIKAEQVERDFIQTIFSDDI
jgi:hypothetical protein